MKSGKDKLDSLPKQLRSLQRRLVTVFAVAALLPLGAQAGDTVLTAATDTVNFGMIREDEGKQTQRVWVRNVSDGPSAILKVRPTCGCTAADFFKEEIAPGDSAWIDLSYNPFRRPGSFEKNVRVYPVEGDMLNIPISGTVMASEETLARMFPVDGGLLHLSESTLMTLTPLTERKTLYLDVYNSGTNAVDIQLDSPDEAVSAYAVPGSVAPGDKGSIVIYLDPAREQRSGNLEYILHIHQEGGDARGAQGAGNAAPPAHTFNLKILSEKP